MTQKTGNKHGSKWIRREKRHAIYRRDGHKCVWCGSQKGLTLDHVVPRVLDGSNHHTNLFTSCGSCNSSRGDKSIHLWAVVLAERVSVDPIETGRRARAILHELGVRLHRPIYVMKHHIIFGFVANDNREVA